MMKEKKESFIAKLRKERLHELIDDRSPILVRIKPDLAKYIVEKLNTFLDGDKKAITAFFCLDENYEICLHDVKHHSHWEDDWKERYEQMKNQWSTQP